MYTVRKERTRFEGEFEGERGKFSGEENTAEEEKLALPSHHSPS